MFLIKLEMKSYFCVYSNIWVTEQGLTGRIRYFSISWCFYAQKLSKICFPGSVGDMTQFFITLCILPLSCHLSIALGWDNTRKLEKDKKEIMTAIHCRKIFLKSCTFQFLSFLPLLHLRLETFLIVPITSGNLEKSQIFSAFLDLKTLPPKFKTCLNQSQPDIQSLHSI